VRKLRLEESKRLAQGKAHKTTLKEGTSVSLLPSIKSLADVQNRK
jgi:hypothetical protein